MQKQIGASEGFDSIVYTRTCDVIATPMCKCTLAAVPHCMTAILHCILEFGFGFGAIGDYRGDGYSLRISCKMSLAVATTRLNSFARKFQTKYRNYTTPCFVCVLYNSISYCWFGETCHFHVFLLLTEFWNVEIQVNLTEKYTNHITVFMFCICFVFIACCCFGEICHCHVPTKFWNVEN